MSKQKIRSDFNDLVKQQEKIFAGTWSFNKCVSPLQLKEWFCPVDLGESDDADTQCAHIFVSTAFYTLNYTLILIWPEVHCVRLSLHY